MLSSIFPRIALIKSVRALALAATALAASPIVGQPVDNANNGPPPVYQRRAFDGHGHNRDRFDRRFDRRFQWQSPQVNSGWFQRPYPYHLDYYKMRYGGSYAPYFGNLYGPPQVVTAPPYYGPYYGGAGFEFANPGDSAFGVPYSTAPNGPILQAPIEQQVAPTETSEMPSP